MTLIISILVISLFLLIVLQLLKARNIRRLNRQLTAILDNFGTNELLRVSLRDPGVSDFVENINLLIQRYKKEQRQLIKSNHSFRQEVTNFSHDFRTPLTSIKGFTELLQTELSDSDRQEYTALILQKVISLNQLIDQFYDLAKIESADLQFNFRETTIEQLLAETIAPFFQDFEKQQLTMQIDDSFLREKVYVDVLYMQRILTNVLQNCLRYSHSYVKIYGEVTAEKNFALTIENDSLTESMQIEKLFNRTYSGDASRSQGQAGLGLYIAKQLIEAQGGEIAATFQAPVFKLILSFPSI